MLKPMLRANSVGRCRLRRFVRGGRGRRRGCYWEIKGGRSGVVLSLSSTATAIDPKPTKPRLSAAATRMPSAAPPRVSGLRPTEAPPAARGLVEPRVSKPATPTGISFSGK